MKSCLKSLIVSYQYYLPLIRVTQMLALENYHKDVSRKVTSVNSFMLLLIKLLQQLFNSEINFVFFRYFKGSYQND